MTDFTTNHQQELADMIIWHRKKGKIAQNQLADLAGVSRTAVQRLESGTSPMQTDTLWKILKVLNINVTYTSPLMSIYTKTQKKQKNHDPATCCL